MASASDYSLKEQDNFFCLEEYVKRRVIETLKISTFFATGLCQHYGQYTEEINFSFDPAVAIYFARHKGKGGSLGILDLKHYFENISSSSSFGTEQCSKYKQGFLTTAREELRCLIVGC